MAELSVRLARFAGGSAILECGVDNVGFRDGGGGATCNVFSSIAGGLCGFLEVLIFTS